MNTPGSSRCTTVETTVKRSVRGTGWNNDNNSGPRGIRVYRITQRRTANSRSGSAHAAFRGRRGKRKDSLSIYPCGRCQLLIIMARGWTGGVTVSTPPHYSVMAFVVISEFFPFLERLIATCHAIFSALGDY